MAERLTKLLERIPVDTEQRVENEKRRKLNEIRAILRSECQLSLKFHSKSILVSPGYPIELKSIDFPNDIEIFHQLCLYRKHLEDVLNGGRGLIDLLTNHQDVLSRIYFSEDSEMRGSYDWLSAGNDKMLSVVSMVEEFLRYIAKFRVEDNEHPLTRILSIKEDVLGVYRYKTNFRDVDIFGSDTQEEPRSNWARIELYWAVIGLSALWKPCSVEDLTVVVLTHELAHAFTQLGADAEGRIWNANDFSRTESAVKEGLAQYYTHIALKKLDSDQYTNSSPFQAYEKLLPNQPDIYRTHLNWIEKFKQEDVRLAMLEFRRHREKSLEEFEYRLKRAQIEMSS